MATDARAELSDAYNRTAHLRDKTQQRRDLEAALRAETMGRVAAPLRNLRAGAYKDTHFNDLVVNNAGVGIGVNAVRVERQAKQGTDETGRALSGTPSVFAVNASGTTTGANTTTNANATAAGGGAGGGGSAFAVAYAEEARLAESRDADLTALRKAGGVLRTTAPPTLNRRAQSARLYEQSP